MREREKRPRKGDDGMKTVVSLKELMTRWGVSRASITRMEQAGTLKRLMIPGIFTVLRMY